MPPLILWFRQDLRLADNPALVAALESGNPVLPVYILDDHTPGPWKMGAASRVWLWHTLSALKAQLNNKMLILAGDPGPCLDHLVRATGACGVYWNRCYEPFALARDRRIHDSLTQRGVDVQSFNAALLFEPWAITKADHTPYRVFTPFWKKGCLGGAVLPERPLPPPTIKKGQIIAFPSLDTGIEALNLLPHTPRWDMPLIAHWTPGEAGAQHQFHHFLNTRLIGYKEGRDFPGLSQTSRLSPHLHFGEISVRSIFAAVADAVATDPKLDQDANAFLSELGWREFSNHLLYHNPDLPDRPLQPAFLKFPWADPQNSDQAEMIDRWKQGQTGVAMVDAGMRELWATGYMHNRVRMIVGSYLVKNMLTHWRVGEDWFWDTLVDADLANNATSWQWIAGCGADAAPYYRIFNPDLQAEKFDPKGAYRHQWVPEWGTSRYPKPMLDPKQSRDRALSAFQTLKK